MEKHYKLKCVADTLSVDVETLRSACLNGEIEYLKIRSVMVIPESALRPYKDGQKPRVVYLLEKENERLRAENEALKNVMKSVAGTLLKESHFLDTGHDIVR